MVERHAVPLSDDRHGIAISTFGKVIRRGWDWLGLTPAAHSRVSGLVEAPDLAACLTLSKSDFIRSGPRGAAYLAYRKAIQEVVSRQLNLWGDARDSEARPRTVRLERDLERVLEDLADDFPLLRSLVDRRPGGQKRLPLPGRGKEPVPGSLFANVAARGAAADMQVGSATAPRGEQKPGEAAPGDEELPTAPSPPEGERDPAHAPSPDASGSGSGESPTVVGTLDTVPGRRRPARYGLIVQLESRPGDPELGRLVDSTIWINDAHPAYGRAAASRSSGYHTALTVALALAPLAVGASDEHAFITQFLAHWGGANGAKRARGTRTAKKKRVRQR